MYLHVGSGHPKAKIEMKDLPERKENILLLTLGPVIWAGHFLLSYATVSVWCGKIAGAGGALGAIRGAIVVYTIVAVAGAMLVAWVGYRRHQVGNGSLPHDDDTPEDRHRFLGYASFLLAVLSGVGIVYAGFVTLFFGDCY